MVRMGWPRGQEVKGRELINRPPSFCALLSYYYHIFDTVWTSLCIHGLYFRCIYSYRLRSLFFLSDVGWMLRDTATFDTCDISALEDSKSGF